MKSYPYAKINREDLIKTLQQSKQDNIKICFGMAVTTIWMPKDVSKDLYKKCRDLEET